MRRKVLIAVGAAVIFGVLGLTIYMRAVHARYVRGRAAWAVAAIQRLSAISPNTEPMRTEILDARTSVVADRGIHWTGEHVVIMTNGDYLIYEFRHGFNNGFVDHLLIARDNRSRWWFSTYHFCSGMVGVGADVAPASIEEFAARYSAREFDGTAAACLVPTWDPRAQPHATDAEH